MVKPALTLPLVLLLLYFLFGFLYGGLFYTTSESGVEKFLRTTFYYSWIFIFIALIRNKEEVYRFCSLLFPAVFFVFFCQISLLVSGVNIVSHFDRFFEAGMFKNTLTSELRSMPGGTLVILLCYITSLFFLEVKEKIFSKKYLYLIIAVCFLSIFLSSTRSWFGFFSLIFIGVYANRLKRIGKILLFSAFILLLLFMLIKFGAFSEEYLRNSVWARLSQVFNFIAGRGGDIDTFVSRKEQLSILIPKIEQSILFGYGFSDISLQYYNSNWGFLNTVLMFGVAGLSLFIFLFTSYFKMMLSTLKKLVPNDPMRASLRVFIVSFLAMLGLYSLTWDFFSLFNPAIVAYMMTFFGISEIISREASKTGEKRG
jgi:hypothetical protein